MDHHYPTMNPPFPKPLDYALHQTPPPTSPPLSTSNFFTGKSPPLDGEPPPLVSHPSLPPLLGAFKQPPPPKEKRCHGKHAPPPENICNFLHLTFVVDSGVSDNFKLIMQNTLEVFWLFVV